MYKMAVYSLWDELTHFILKDTVSERIRQYIYYFGINVRILIRSKLIDKLSYIYHNKKLTTEVHYSITYT